MLTSCSAPQTTGIAAKAGPEHRLARGGIIWPKAGGSSSTLRGLLWRAPGKERGVVVCLHGIQTHSAWFGPLANELNRRGWTVFAPDRRGSGLNADFPFHRGHTTGSAELLDDLQGHMKMAAELADGRPIILLGTSWGSNLASMYVASSRKPTPNGLVQLVPATKVQPCFQPSPWKKVAAVVANVFVPGKTAALPFTAEHYLAGADQLALRAERPPRFPCSEALTSEPELSTSNERLLGVLRDDEVLLQEPTIRTQVTGQMMAKRWPMALRKAEDGPAVLLITACRDRIMDNSAAAAALTGLKSVTIASIDDGHGMQITKPSEIADIIASWSATIR